MLHLKFDLVSLSALIKRYMRRNTFSNVIRVKWNSVEGVNYTLQDYFLYVIYTINFQNLYIYIYIYVCVCVCVCVVYWPITRQGCQNRKCTYVNNRCIRSRNIRIITLTVDGLNECNCDARKKVDVELLYNSVKTGSQTVGVQTS